MKRQILVTLAALSGLIALGAPPARAQFEIDPDHFEGPNTEPLGKVKADTSSNVGTIRYDGKVRLAHTVECHGKSRHAKSGRPNHWNWRRCAQTRAQAGKRRAHRGTPRNNTETVSNPSSETGFCARS